jgi:hypothetical protein
MSIMTVLLPLAFTILGALVYALAANPKASEMGRLTFGAAVLVLIYVLSHTSLHLSV